MRIKVEKGAFPPVREHMTDAGLDVRAMFGGMVPAGGSETFRTGLHVELPPGHAGLMVSKSGLMVNYDITSSGLIDEGYDGEVMVKLFNHGPKDFEVKAGDKISQLVILPVMYEPVEVVNSIRGGKRGSRGFGSTGRGVVKSRARLYGKGAKE